MTGESKQCCLRFWVWIAVKETVTDETVKYVITKFYAFMFCCLIDNGMLSL